MKSIFTVLISTLMISNALANDNPDAGSLMRMVCYSLEAGGQNDLTKRRLNETIIVDQIYNLEMHDASYFIPGNKNFDTDVGVDGRAQFNIYVYKAAKQWSSEKDKSPHSFVGEKDNLQNYAETLLKTPSQDRFEKVEGVRNFFLDQITFDLYGEKDGSEVNFGTDGSNTSYYANLKSGTNNNELETWTLYCEKPFAIPVEVPQTNADGEITTAELSDS